MFATFLKKEKKVDICSTVSSVSYSFIGHSILAQYAVVQDRDPFADRGFRL